MLTAIYSFISGLMFRIRGGLRIPFTDKKFPLCKWWFAVWFACLACILKGWSWRFWLVILIATRASTMLCGWGEYKGCALGVGKPNKNRYDCYEIDEFVDNFEFRGWKLIDHPILFGIVGLSLRGLYLTFIIGLALNSIPYILCGAWWGIECYLCGLFARKVLKKYDKTGWNLDEWCFGTWLGFWLCLVL
jgi:hypothetical protein